MPVRRREQGGKQGDQGRATIASILGIELERERAQDKITQIETPRQDYVNLVVWNKRTSDFTPGGENDESVDKQ